MKASQALPVKLGVPLLMFEVWGLSFRVWGLAFWVWGLFGAWA